MHAICRLVGRGVFERARRSTPGAVPPAPASASRAAFVLGDQATSGADVAPGSRTCGLGSRIGAGARGVLIGRQRRVSTANAAQARVQHPSGYAAFSNTACSARDSPKGADRACHQQSPQLMGSRTRVAFGLMRGQFSPTRRGEVATVAAARASERPLRRSRHRAIRPSARIRRPDRVSPSQKLTVPQLSRDRAAWPSGDDSLRARCDRPQPLVGSRQVTCSSAPGSTSARLFASASSRSSRCTCARAVWTQRRCGLTTSGLELS